MTIKFVTKSDGSKVLFARDKIVATCVRARADTTVAKEIAQLVESTLPDGSTTHQIYDFVIREMEKRSPRAAALFGIRNAIADLDSESFERYTKAILEANGWKCLWNQILQGRASEHQIDVIAQRDGETWVVECKRHFNPHRWCGLDVALQVQARLEDLRDGSSEHKNKYQFAGVWIFTNTKFSEHAKTYANAKAIRMTGWRSGEFGIEKLVEEKKVWPVTMLKIDLATKSKLLANHIITVNDILTTKRPLLQNWTDVVTQARLLMR